VGLLAQAAADVRAFLQDVDGGFAQAITVWDPSSNKLELKGFANRISQQIDAQTGEMVSADIVTVALPVASFAAGKLPVGVSDTGSRPWLVAFTDVAGHYEKFKVRETIPDLTLGVIVCVLEQWKGA
jgi:hypothetical protein